MNPFQLVYDALWDMMLAHGELAAVVKPKNRIRFDGESRDPIKEVVQPADLPELLLVPLGVQEANLHATTCTTHIYRQYQFILATGDARLSEGLDTVSWYMLCAMANWKATLAALTWNERPFVQNLRLSTITDGLSNSEQNRNIRGWSSIWGCEVFMQFRTEDLKDEL